MLKHYIVCLLVLLIYEIIRTFGLFEDVNYYYSSQKNSQLDN